MRLLMLNNEFPPLGGGTGTVNEALLRQLTMRSDIEVDLVTSAADQEREETQFSRRIRLIRLPVPGHEIHHASNRALAIYALRALRESLSRHRARPYDACLAWSTVPAGVVARVLKQVVGLPYVVRVSGPDIPGFERRYRYLYPILRPIIRSAWHRASFVVAKCQAEAAMIRVVDEDVQVRIVANGVDLEAFGATDRRGTRSLRLLCVGRLIERKGQDQLLRSLHALRALGMDVRLELVGEGDARPSLEQLAEALGLQNAVHFAGYVPRDRIAAVYGASDIFVLPSFNEGMSVATLEAMASGLPVVVTRVGGVDELVAEGVNGLTFDWGDIGAMTECLQRLAADAALRSRMGGASRDRAAAFSWDRMTRELLGIIAEVKSSGPTSDAASRPATS